MAGQSLQTTEHPFEKHSNRPARRGVDPGADEGERRKEKNCRLNQTCEAGSLVLEAPERSLTGVSFAVLEDESATVSADFAVSAVFSD